MFDLGILSTPMVNALKSNLGHCAVGKGMNYIKYRRMREDW